MISSHRVERVAKRPSINICSLVLAGEATPAKSKDLIIVTESPNADTADPASLPPKDRVWDSPQKSSRTLNRISVALESRWYIPTASDFLAKSRSVAFLKTWETSTMMFTRVRHVGYG